MSGENRLSKVTEFGEQGSTESIYDDWAATYDSDLGDTYGYNAPATGADALDRMVSDRTLEVIDYGCGTGLVGAELRRRGFTTVDGADISDGMLDIAHSKGLYRRLFQADLTEPVDIADGAYEAMICIGSMGNGHLGPEHVPELVRTVTPSGPVVLYMNAKPWIEHDYASAFHDLERAGLWQIERIEATNYMAALDRPGRLVVARRSAD